MDPRREVLDEILNTPQPRPPINNPYAPGGAREGEIEAERQSIEAGVDVADVGFGTEDYGEYQQGSGGGGLDWQWSWELPGLDDAADGWRTWGDADPQDRHDALQNIGGGLLKGLWLATTGVWGSLVEDRFDAQMAALGLDPSSGFYDFGVLTFDIISMLIPFSGGPLRTAATRSVTAGGRAVLPRITQRVGQQAGSACRRNSFTKGTPVLMGDGTTKPIEEVAEGEEVLATDPGTGEQAPRQVLATITGTGMKTLVEITVDTETQIPAEELDDGDLPDDTPEPPPGPVVLGEAIIATTGHPFWAPEHGEWLPAGELTAGTWLLSSEGVLVQVTSTSTWTQPATVYNLTVDEDHTYHVQVGDTDVLVHNCREVPASTPVGSRGNKLDTVSGNNPTTIGRIDYSGHALDRMQQQGITPSVVENAVRGQPIPG